MVCPKCQKKFRYYNLPHKLKRKDYFICPHCKTCLMFADRDRSELYFNFGLGVIYLAFFILKIFLNKAPGSETFSDALIYSGVAIFFLIAVLLLNEKRGVMVKTEESDIGISDRQKILELNRKNSLTRKIIKFILVAVILFLWFLEFLKILEIYG